MRLSTRLFQIDMDESNWLTKFVCRTVWTAEAQSSFSETMGKALAGWTTIVENQLSALFSGSNSSMALLGTLIGNGNLLECNGGSPS